jgi:hypothetical protein
VNGVLFVAQYGSVQTFRIAINTATGALTLTHRSSIAVDRPWALACTPDGSRVFMVAGKRISCIDVESDAVRPFVGVGEADAICLADGLLGVRGMTCTH